MIHLRGRTKEASVPAEAGKTILDHALKAGVDWGFSCTRGTCARCRCLIEAGAEWLEEITDAEWDRMDPEEFDEGYRLGCQAVVRTGAGEIRAVNRTYF